MLILFASSHTVEKDLISGEAFDHWYKERNWKFIEVKFSQISTLSLAPPTIQATGQFLESVNIVTDYSF